MNMESYHPQENTEETPVEHTAQDTNPITKWAKRAIVAAGLTLGTLHGAEAQDTTHALQTEQVSEQVRTITHAFEDIDSKESADEFIATTIGGFIHQYEPLMKNDFSEDENRILKAEATLAHQYVENLATRFPDVDTSSLAQLEKLEAFFSRNN